MWDQDAPAEACDLSDFSFVVHKKASAGAKHTTKVGLYRELGQAFWIFDRLGGQGFFLAQQESSVPLLHSLGDFGTDTWDWQATTSHCGNGTNLGRRLQAAEKADRRNGRL